MDLKSSVKQHLEKFEPKLYTKEFPFESIKKSAVAIVLREYFGILELFFIVRATRPDDFWSGNIAFPGGRYSSIHDNYSLKQTAIRETREEVGLDLEKDFDYLGALNEMLVPSFLLLVQPHVFLQKESSKLLQLQLDEREVAHAHWFPISFLFEQFNLLAHESSQLSKTSILIPLDWKRLTSSMFLERLFKWAPNWLQIVVEYPNFELYFPSSKEKHYLWGLTLRIVSEFFKDAGIYQAYKEDQMYSILKQKLYGVSNYWLYNYFVLQNLDDIIYKSHKTALLDRLKASKL